MIKYLQKSIIMLFLFSGHSFAVELCHPEVSQKDNNYIIGYGSLMQRESRKSTHPNAMDVYPVEVKGFKRIWGIHGQNYKTTFLTVIKDKDSYLNAVYYPSADYEILGADEREIGYCRILISRNDLNPLGLSSMPEGKYWIYVRDEDKISSPSIEYPIVQSYVDIFLDGCIQIGNTYLLPKFLENCVVQTYGWPKEVGFWLNDRQFPRRPFRTPNAFYIDKILSKNFPNYHQHPIE